MSRSHKTVSCPRFTGVAATLLEIGRATYDQAMYRPEETNRERLGLQQPHVLLLLHPREHAFRGWHGEPSEDGVCDGRKQTEDRRNRRTNVIVVLCGPIASACEELRHRRVHVDQEWSFGTFFGVTSPRTSNEATGRPMTRR